MPTAGLLRIHRASRVSDAVPRRIGHAGAGAMRVQSVYRSVVNITTADGLLTVASPEGGGLPNGILADLGPDWRAIGLQRGMVVTAGDSAIRVPDAGLEIRFDAAPRWSPRFASSATAAHVASARWRRRAAATRTIAQARASAAGFGALLSRGSSGRSPQGYVEVARPVVARLILALEAGDRDGAAAVAARLIGLGPGLTPSGDDVLVGIEAALHALAQPSAGFLALALGDVEARTTDLAATLLRHAAAGEFAERLHTLLAALLGSDDERDPGRHRAGRRLGRDVRHRLPARGPDRPRRRGGRSRGVGLMSAVRSRIFANSYRDSVELMQIAAELESLAGIDRAGLVMATPANREVLAAAGLLSDETASAGPNDLVVAVASDDEAAATQRAGAGRGTIGGAGHGGLDRDDPHGRADDRRSRG